MQMNPELPLQKPVMMHYQINREERHFGFLFLTAIVSNPLFRKELFDLLNSRSDFTLMLTNLMSTLRPTQSTGYAGSHTDIFVTNDPLCFKKKCRFSARIKVAE